MAIRLLRFFEQQRHALLGLVLGQRGDEVPKEREPLRQIDQPVAVACARHGGVQNVRSVTNVAAFVTVPAPKGM